MKNADRTRRLFRARFDRRHCRHGWRGDPGRDACL